MRKGRGTCAGSRGGPRAGATAAGGCRAGELRNPYSRLSGLSSSGRAARQASRRRWLPGPWVLETLAASPCRGWSRRARRCSFRPAPGPEVRRRHRPAAVSAGRRRRSDPLVRAASGQVSGCRPRGASPAASVPRAAQPCLEPAGGGAVGWRSGGGSVRGPARCLCWRTPAERGPPTVCTGSATSDD